MKILKLILYSVTLLLAVFTIIISQGSALSKFADFSAFSLIVACGYIPYFWVLILSIIVFILFLLLKHIRIALSYLTVMVLFTLLLGDFSLGYIFNREPENIRDFDSLNVVTYNVRYYSSGIEKITRFINESNFDVVLLSESVLTPEHLEYLKKYLPAYSVLTDNGHDVSLLSRYPIVDYKMVDLPTYHASLSGSNDLEKLGEKGINRSFIHAVVDVHGEHVNVLSLRLIAGRAKDKSITEGLKWGQYLLEAQKKELEVFLNYISILKGPVVFGGDLNAPPNSEIIHEISQYADDAYLDNHPFGSFTFRTVFPMMRLDYIFHSKDVIVKNSGVVDVRLSDHFPVRAEIYFPKKSQQAMKLITTMKNSRAPIGNPVYEEDLHNTNRHY